MHCTSAKIEISQKNEIFIKNEKSSKYYILLLNMTK